MTLAPPDSERVKRLEQKIETADADLRDARRDLAALGEEPSEPALWWPLILFTAVGLAVTLMLSFHEIVFARLMADAKDALIASLLFGCSLSVPIVGHVVWSAQMTTPTVRAATVRIFLSTSLFAGGLLLLRLGTDGTAPVEISLGFAVIEASLLLALEASCATFAGRRAEWVAERQAWGTAVARVAAAEDELADREDALAPAKGEPMDEGDEAETTLDPEPASGWFSWAATQARR